MHKSPLTMTQIILQLKGHIGNIMIVIQHLMLWGTDKYNHANLKWKD